MVSTKRGGTIPKAWIVYDEKVMGGSAYGRTLRANLKTLEGESWGIADSLAAVPKDVRQLTLCGQSASLNPQELVGRFMHLADLRVLNPEKPEDWLALKVGGKRPQVICGEFFGHCPDDELQGLTVVPGARDFLWNWPRLAWGRVADGDK